MVGFEVEIHQTKIDLQSFGCMDAGALFDEKKGRVLFASTQKSRDVEKEVILKHVKKQWTFQVSARIAIIKGVGVRVDNIQKQGKSLEFSVLHRWLKICIDLHCKRQGIYSSSCVSGLQLFKSIFV